MTISERTKLIQKSLLKLKVIKDLLDEDSRYIDISILDRETLDRIEKVIDTRIKEQTEALQEV